MRPVSHRYYDCGMATLNEYLKGDGAMTVNELAAAVGVPDPAQVRQWQHGYAGRKPSPEMAVRIERATAGAVTRRDLRPDDWSAIWPELADGDKG